MLAFLGVALLVVSLLAAGWTQGHDLLDAKISFADIAAHTRSWLLVAAAAQGILLLGNLLLFVNFLETARGVCFGSASAPSEIAFHQPGAMEVTP